jgi:hypothetical protein
MKIHWLTTFACRLVLVLTMGLAGQVLAQEAAEDSSTQAADTTAAVKAEPAKVSEAPVSEAPEVKARAKTVRRGQVDRLELDTTSITGNSELPTVLYIVPWQAANPGDLDGRPVNSLLEEVLAPVDRDVFLRQVDYFGQLYGDGQSTVAP